MVNNKDKKGGWSGVIRETKKTQQEGRKVEKLERDKKKKQGRKVKDGEKGSQGRSAMEKYEWVLGVCILDWGRPLSDRERCGCSQW